MASSGSYARGDQPRSVPDPDAEAYDAAMRKQRAYNATQAAEEERRRAEVDDANRRARLLGDRMFGSAAKGARTPHPSVIQSMIPIAGSAQEAIADAEEGNYLGATANAALAVSDVVPVKAVAGGMLKGGLKLSGPFVWRSAPWKEAGMRKWLGKQGFLKSGQPGHHWVFEQASNLPDWFKNQPPFIKGMHDAVDHGRVHGPWKDLPRYDPLERYWRGTPDWWKALKVSAAGHMAGAASAARRQQNWPPAAPPPLMGPEPPR